MKMLTNFSLSFFFLCLFLVACKKETFITSSNANVNITRDSIKFDTVFTSAGSVTKSFKVINENNQKLRLSKVKLMGGATSSFKININGSQVFEEDNIEIPANDSIYVFVTIFINPTSANLPFIISDSILINYNDIDRFVQLEAYGQNAHFLNNVLLNGNHVWTNDLPYVILGSIRVDTAASLLIEAGCKIYAHANAAFLVDGTLTISGTKDNEVQFTGDRLDEYYRDLPASWPGIYFRGSSINNEITFAIIKNANRGIDIEEPSSNGNPKLTMHQCIIDNAFEAGLYSYNSSVYADNSLITNCGNNLFIEYGGTYNFANCTVACYSNTYLLHTNPVLQATDATTQNDGSTATNDLNASFINCIFWGEYGNVDDEVIVTKLGSNVFNVNMQNCIYKAVNDPANTMLTASLPNQDPLFDSVDVNNKYFDFRVTKNLSAPGINTGINIAGFPKDLDNNDRNAGGFIDIGSYEKQ
ncbi:MAG: hypothetical protein ABIT58_08065 [Ferruginibacter sp.]